MSETPATTPDSNTAQSGTAQSAFPQFAVDAANRQIGKVGDALTGAADSIDTMFDRQELPFGDQLQGYAADGAAKLRRWGAQAGEQDAGALMTDLQRTAAARPVLAVAIGAGLGVALALFLVQTAPSAPTAS
jgi:hypothetical protein